MHRDADVVFVFVFLRVFRANAKSLSAVCAMCSASGNSPHNIKNDDRDDEANEPLSIIGEAPQHCVR